MQPVALDVLLGAQCEDLETAAEVSQLGMIHQNDL